MRAVYQQEIMSAQDAERQVGAGIGWRKKLVPLIKKIPTRTLSLLGQRRSIRSTFNSQAAHV